MGVVQESAEGEHRVALSPSGDSAWLPDAEYAAAGAGLVSGRELHARADVVVRVQPPAAADRVVLRPGQVLLGLLQPLTTRSWPRGWPAPG